MQNQNSPRQYVPVHCSKCKSMNNAAQSSVCRFCGSSLTSAGGGGGSANWSSASNSGKRSVRPYIMTVVSIVIAVAGWVYQSNRNPSPGAPSATNAENVKLPPGSWHNQSWWSYVSSYPSVAAVLEKNMEVSGREILAEDVKTLSVSGKFLTASGICFTPACTAEQGKLDKDRRIYVGDKQVRVIKTDQEVQREIQTDFSDGYNLDFAPVGLLEIHTKNPDKVMRAIKLLTPNTANRSQDVYTGFDGRNGWQKEGFTDSSGRISITSNKEVSEQGLESLKQDLSSMWRTSTLIKPDARVSGLKDLPGGVAFVLTQTGDSKLPSNLYFDTVTGLLKKMDMADMSVYFNDYRDFEGSKLPYMIYYRRRELTGRYTWIRFDVNEWRINYPLEDSIFEK